MSHKVLMRTWCVVAYVFALIVLLSMSGCMSGPDPILMDSITQGLVAAGMEPVQAQAIAAAVGAKVAEASSGLPDWLQLGIDGVILAMFPALATIRNRSRVAQLDHLKTEVIAAVKPSVP